MRRILAFLLLLPLSHAHGSWDDQPIVIGIGNRLSGKISVEVEGAEWTGKFEALARDLKKRCSLELEVRPQGPATFSVPASAKGYAVDLLRAAILDKNLINHIPSAFARVERSVTEDRLTLGVWTHLRGEITMDLLTVEGNEVLPAGKVRPIDLTAIEDPDGTLVRLRYLGPSGLTDEIRYWLPDLLPGGGEVLRLEGAEKLPVGEPAFFRIVVTGLEGEPVAGREVRAAGVTATTDESGVATITLPPFSKEDLGEKEMLVRVGRSRHPRSLTARYEIVPRPRRLLAETDRPVYRPGGDVTIRVLSIDAVSRAARPGDFMMITIRDPKRRVLAKFEKETGRFGEAVHVLPLAMGIDEGRYAIEADTGESVARTSFRVEEIRLPPFKVTANLDRGVFGDKESVEVRVGAETFTGEPLAGAAVRWKLEDRKGRISLGPKGVGEITVPAGKSGSRHATLAITVEKAGAIHSVERRVLIRKRRPAGLFVTTEPAPLVAGVPGRIRLVLRDDLERPTAGWVEVSIDGKVVAKRAGSPLDFTVPVETEPDRTGITLRVAGKTAGDEEVQLDLSLPLSQGGVLLCKDVLDPGQPAAVELRTTRQAGAALLDLLIDGRFVGSAGGTIEDGRCVVELPVRADLGGPARLIARMQDGRWIGSRIVRIGTSDLSVSVNADPAESRPGETVTLRAEVLCAAGPKPALLDVRGFDRAYLDFAGGLDSKVPGFLDKPAAKSGPYELAFVGPIEPLAALESRAARVVREAMAGACADHATGGWAPWGSPIVRYKGRVARYVSTHRIFGGDAILAVTEPPVTARPGREGEYPLACPVDFSWSTRTEGLVSAEEILPSRAPEPPATGRYRQSVVDRGLDNWLKKHQSPDGSWRPHRFPERCGKPPCENRGHPYLHPGSTALAILAYLGAGETHRHGNHKKTVKSGLRYLKAVQGEDGFFGDPSSPWALLNHSMATLAMCEAYGLTGSPLFKQSAAAGVNRLLTEQRADGSFGERTFREGSLVLTGWATMAMKSAKAAGLVAKREAFEGVRKWIHGREVRASAEERATYPFALEDGTTGPAGITALILIFTGDDPRRLAEEYSTIPLPQHPETDAHAAYWGDLAAFQIGGQVWRAYSAALKAAVVDHQVRDGCEKGSWSPERSPMGRVAATALSTMCLEVYYRYGRVFGAKGGGGGGSAAPRVRRSFLDAAIANLAVPTDDFGRAAIDVALPDNVTTWDLLVGAWDGKGGYAVGRGAVRSTLPIAIECEIPERLLKGDRITVPLRVRSRLDATAEVRIAVETSPNLTVVDLPRKLIDVKPGDVFAVPVVVEAKAAGPATVKVTATGEEHADAWERSLVVRSDRYPFALVVPVPFDGKTGAADRLPADAGLLTAQLEIAAGPTAEADSAFRGLIRRPTGCFEQTAATLYPMIYALSYLERTGLSDEKLSNAARRHLLTGYQRLLSFGVEGGGFSLYGDEPAEPALTALGVHLFKDLQKFQAVDEAVLRGAAGWLEKHLPKKGAARIYALGALKRAGRSVGPVLPNDAYLLSLAVVHGLVPEDARDAARETLEGAHIIEEPTLFAGGETSRTEVSALRLSALRRLGGNEDLVLHEADELRSRREANGGWPTTRETVVALRALLAVAETERAAGRVTVDGKTAFDITPGARRVIDFGPWDRDRQIGVAFEGTGRPRARLVIRGTSERPPAMEADLAIDVTWPAKPVAAGERTTVTIDLEAKARVHAPMVVVPLPGGFRPDGRIKPGYRFSMCLVREGRLELYLNSLVSGQTASMEIRLIPEFRGKFTPAPAEAYPYYTPDRTALEPGPEIVVE